MLWAKAGQWPAGAELVARGEARRRGYSRTAGPELSGVGGRMVPAGMGVGTEVGAGAWRAWQDQAACSTRTCMFTRASPAPAARTATSRIWPGGRLARE